MSSSPSNLRSLWKPDDFSPDRPARKVSWLELFHDLVYVVAVSKLAHALLNGNDLATLGLFTLCFSLVLWSWMNGVYYFDLHGNQGMWSRGFTFVQLVFAAGASLTLDDAFHDDHRPFAIAFSCMQALITFLWWSTGWFDKEHRPLSVPHSTTYAVGLLCFLVSCFVERPVAIVLWTIGLAVNFGVELVIYPRFQGMMRRLGAEFKPSASIVERFGLFTIIVLGESVVGIMNGMEAASERHLSTWGAFLLCMLVAFLLWWLYFEVLGDREPRPGFRNYVLLNLLHLPLFAALGMLGPWLHSIISLSGPRSLDARWMSACCISAFLLLIPALSSIMADDPLSPGGRGRENRRMVITACVVAVLPLVPVTRTGWIFVLLLACILLSVVLLGLFGSAYAKLRQDPLRTPLRSVAADRT